MPPGDSMEKVPLQEGERTATIKDYLRVFTYATPWDNLVLTAGILAAIASGVTQPLMFILFGSFVGEFSGFVTSNGGVDFDNTEHTLNRLCLFVFALFIARFGLTSIHKFAFRMIGIRLSAALRLHYLRHLFDQSMHVLDSLPPGHAVGTITASSNTLQAGISEKLSIFIEYVALIIASFVVAVVWNWELSLVTVAGFVAVVLVVSTLFPLTVKSQVRQTRLEGQAAGIASESFASIRMIMACNAQQQMVDKYSAFIEEARKQAQATNPLASLQFSLTFFGVFGIVALTFWYGALIFTKSRLDNVGVITVVLLNLTTIFFSLDRVSSPMQTMSKALLAACEFFSVIDAPVPEKGTLKTPDVSAMDDIVFNNVTFAYPSRPDVKVLDQLDLRIEAGKITAITGPSGSGKSTIVGLIERWYTLTKQHAIPKSTQQGGKEYKGSENDAAVENCGVTGAEAETSGHPVDLQGTITTCSHSLDEIDVKWWRSRIGLVQQEPFLFNDTIYENVARGLIGSPWDRESAERKRELVKEACQEAFADEFIERLPLGYDTKIGDGGARLSGGQRQRLAIARSIIKNPDILILDEATSAIDVRGERVVQAALDKAGQHRTTIVIAHRLSAIKNADHIVVLKKGRIVESGTHESLVCIDGGVYSSLVNAQALSLEGHIRDIENDLDAEDIDILNREETEAKPDYDSNRPEYDKEKGKTSRRLFGSFCLLFLESNNYWTAIAFGIFMSAAAGTAQPLYAWMFAKSINLFKWQDDHSKLMDEVDFMGIMWTVFAASSGIAYFITFLCSSHVASFIRAKYQVQYFQSLIFQPAAYFDEDSHSHGTLVARVRDDPRKLEEMMGINIAQVCIAIFNIIGGLIVALVYSWKLALVSLCAVAPVCVFSGYIRFRYEVQFESMNDAVFAESSQFASEAIGAFRTVTSLTLENTFFDRFERLCQGHVISAYKKARWALIFYYGGRLLTGGEIGMMAFFVCLMAIMNAAEGFGKSLSFGPNATQATTASDRIMDARESSLLESPEKYDIPAQEGGIRIELRDICLRYPTQRTPVFNGLNMTIEKGQFAALVGASGCGKTSIVSLLERFHEPGQGQILFNGKDISDVNIYGYRKHLSLVAQEPTLVQGTIRDNILLGIDSSTITDDQLHTACRDASIHDFIESLPESYNTNVGTRGVGLSGGQKQRIAIARALIRNPQVLLLDEATSSLDSESERVVQAALEQAAKGRTMIAVAHRLATVQNADVIFVLGEGGKVLEKGGHLELLKNRGVYYQMCQSQALDR
ncbi:P-loop containing nucleoside triphosphate hydrolase protein [Aspergillus sclerotiicarbonarius CBS 121057]|uniref:ABC multidrug transporter MDR2 n=1 Tax=Aspergillus sclerotiicarbonarius (strain CBS 121057 / IBT 28362) TaxID=1448318 RepID=A0A319ESH9_ASPSB|nr:P-loop containing nucleoside triphosphate hydrolase protein [Aspergillus sclerotiicarbonarius CBS 121057]